jgi:hypothetical protein
LTDIKDTDWAYAAGFVDGEGCIAIVRSFTPSRGRYCHSVHVVVANSDRNVLDWIKSTWGGWVGRVLGARPARDRVAWHWRCSATVALPFLSGIRPWLRIKSPQCDNALAMMSLLNRSRRPLGRQPLPPEWLIEQEELYWRQRGLNHRGSTPFVRRAMHSPRQISRDRAASRA